MTAALLAMLLACGDVTVPQPNIEEPVSEEEGWAHVRRALTRSRNCYRSWAEYCITDPKLLDAIVQHALDRHFDGRMPERRRDVDELTRDATLTYVRWLRTDEGIDALEERLHAYYEDPGVERVPGKGISVRVGMPPGRLSVVGDPRRPDPPIALTSPLVVRGEWDTREIARFLERYLAEYPDEPAVRLFVTLPRGHTGVRRLDIRYLRDLDRILVQDLDEPGTGWISEPVGGNLGPYRDGSASLHTSALSRCPVDAAGRPRCDVRGDPR